MKKYSEFRVENCEKCIMDEWNYQWYLYFAKLTLAIEKFNSHIFHYRIQLKIAKGIQKSFETLCDPKGKTIQNKFNKVIPTGKPVVLRRW